MNEKRKKNEEKSTNLNVHTGPAKGVSDVGTNLWPGALQGFFSVGKNEI